MAVWSALSVSSFIACETTPSKVINARAAIPRAKVTSTSENPPSFLLSIDLLFMGGKTLVRPVSVSTENWTQLLTSARRNVGDPQNQNQVAFFANAGIDALPEGEKVRN